jgi:hypothetical protein
MAHTDIPGAAESIAFAQDEVIAAGQFREDTGTVFAMIALHWIKRKTGAGLLAEVPTLA